MGSGAKRLPATMRVIVRDWLSANHVLFLTEGDNVLVDSGYGARCGETLARLADVLGDQPLHRIVNTHVHSDHIGGNAELKRRHGCSIALPAAEAELIRSWDTRALLLDFADQRCERFEFDALIHPGDTLRCGGIAWRAIAAPGHDMGALMFYSPEERILLAGDALWENGFGFIAPEIGSTHCLDAAEATVDTIAALPIELVIPGHGRPFTDVGGAVARARSRIAQFRREPAKMVTYALKAFFVFALLDRGRLAITDYETYLRSIPVYREWSTAFLGRRTQDLAASLINELERAGAVVRQDGWLLPG